VSCWRQASRREISIISSAPGNASLNQQYVQCVKSETSVINAVSISRSIGLAARVDYSLLLLMSVVKSVAASWADGEILLAAACGAAHRAWQA
jgi:hypothetical protein